jgi:hypothetical protein
LELDVRNADVLLIRPFGYNGDAQKGVSQQIEQHLVENEILGLFFVDGLHDQSEHCREELECDSFDDQRMFH